MRNPLHLLTLALCLSGYAAPLSGQEPCQGTMPADDCTEAPLFCQVKELDGYCFSMSPDHSPAGPGPICDQGGVTNNTHWVAFVASCPSFNLRVTPSNCEYANGQIGIQVAVYDYGEAGPCPAADAWPQEIIACQATPCFTNPLTLNLENLRVGGLYYIMVDGCDGSVCDVTFTIETPCDSSGIGDWPFIITGPDQVCTGSTTSYSVFQPSGATLFQWILDGEEVDLGPSNTVTITWTKADTLELCVRAGNACIPPAPGPAPNCLTIEVFDLETQDPPPVLICIGDSHPYPGGPYGPGTWQVNLKTPQGCDSVVTLVVRVDSADVDLGDFVLCATDTLQVLDKSFTCLNAGPQQVFYQKDTPPFCTGRQHLRIHCFQAGILPHNDIHYYPHGRMTLYAREYADASGRYFTYQWSTSDGILSDTSDLPKLVVWEPGVYCLTVSMFSPDSVLLCQETVCTRVRARVNIEPSPACTEAPLLCDPWHIYEIQMSPEVTGQGPAPICAQGGAPHNTHWLAFHAPAEAFRLLIEPSNCTVVGGQLGIQTAVYRFPGDGLCSGVFTSIPDEMDCQSIPCFSAPWSLNLKNLETGRLYYLLIDGCAGATCDVAISFTELPDTLPIPTWEGDLEGPAELCQGDRATFQAPAAAIGIPLTWTLKDSLIAVAGLRWQEITFPEPGTYTLCVTPDLPCHPEWGPARKTCREVTVHPVPRRTGRDVYVCRDDFVTVHGVHWGCDFEGEQEIVYQQIEEPHCDSIRSFQLICLSPTPRILPPETLSDSTWLLDGSDSDPGPSGASVTLRWIARAGGILLGPDDEWTAVAAGPGEYCLLIRSASPNGAVSCLDSVCVAINGGQLPDLARFGAGVTLAGIHLFPQPAGGEAWVAFGEEQDAPGQIIVHNTLGQEMLRQWKPEGERLMPLHLEGWPSGLYLFGLYREGQAPVTLRLLVSR
jgi:hypothetical protein